HALVERTPFVGRETERAELRRCLDQVAKGQGGLVMIGGEPGVGKTRLAEELMAEARQRGMTALIGHCYEMEGAPPYIPFVEILEAAARMLPPEAMRETLGDSAPEVAKLMPGLRRLFPDIPAPPELPPEQERRYLFNGMRDFVARTGRNQPAVYVLDDLHWADEPTMLLLQHIAQQLHEMPVLILGTYRDVELDVARPLARALEELTRQRLAHRLPVKRLPQNGVSAMLRALSGQEPPKPLVDTIYSETEGNPFFVEEVFQHLAEEGKLFDTKGRWRSDLEVGELDVPEGVRLVIGRRLERASEECRRVLTSAAVIGRGFSFELLEALGEADTDMLLDAVDEAERANLIAAAEDGPAQTGALPGEARFRFAHELIRQTWVSGLSLPRRQRMHLRVADAIEQAYSRSLEDHAADLAHHLYQAGAAADPEKTVRYLTLAGEQAMASAAFEDGLRHYDDALTLQPVDDRKGRADLLYKRGQALRSLGRWEEGLADWREALDTYEELGDAEAVGRISYGMSWQLAWVASYEEGVELARRGIAALGDRVSADRVRLLSMAGRMLSADGDYKGGGGMIEQAFNIAEELGDKRLLGEVLGSRTLHHHYYMQVREAVEDGRISAELLRSAGAFWDLGDTLWATQLALGLLGRFDEVVQISDELEPLVARAGHQGALLMDRRARAYQELCRTADLEAWEQFARADLELCRSAGTSWVIFASYLYLGAAHFWRGRWREAAENHQEAYKQRALGPYACFGWAALFSLKAYCGDREEALALLGEKRGDLPRPGQPNPWGAWSWLYSAVEGLAVLGETGEKEEAARLYPLVLEAIETGALTNGFNRLLQTVAGIAAAAGGQWEKAEEHYQTALRQAHELPVVMEQPEVRRWYARMLIDRDGPGDRDRARELLTEAIAMYRRIGMPKHVEMAEAMLGEL
ncbi:MAG: AAA family ATPase, partial [Dehalococcoidia bacterium]